MKVTAGFEMLLAETNEVLLTSESRRTLVRETRAMVETGYVGSSNAELGTWSNEEDSEDWLQIDFTEFVKGLKGAPAAGRWGDNVDQEGELKRMVERLEEFLNDDKAGPDDEELNSDGDISDEDDDEAGGENKAVCFGEDEFERTMRDMMGVPPPSADEEEEAAIRCVHDQIEKELAEAGAIQKMLCRKFKRVTIATMTTTVKEVVDIDYTLAKNLLESFKDKGT